MAVGALASIAVFVGAIYLLITSVFTGNDAYATAMERVRANPVLLRELGTPIESGWGFAGTVKIGDQNDDG